MAVVATPVSGRLRLTYMDTNTPDLRLSGINPLTSAIQFTAFTQAVQSLQNDTIRDGFLITDIDLSED